MNPGLSIGQRCAVTSLLLISVLAGFSSVAAQGTGYVTLTRQRVDAALAQGAQKEDIKLAEASLTALGWMTLYGNDDESAERASHLNVVVAGSYNGTPRMSIYMDHTSSAYFEMLNLNRFAVEQPMAYSNQYVELTRQRVESALAEGAGHEEFKLAEGSLAALGWLASFGNRQDSLEMAEQLARRAYAAWPGADEVYMLQTSTAYAEMINLGRFATLPREPQAPPPPQVTPPPQVAPKRVPVAAELGLQSSLLPGAQGRNRIPISRSDPAYSSEKLLISPAIYLDVTLSDGTRIGPHDYKKQFAGNTVFDDVTGDPSDLIRVVYWDVDSERPGLGKYAAQLTSTGKGVGTATLRVSFRDAPGVTASVPVEVVGAPPSASQPVPVAPRPPQPTAGAAGGRVARYIDRGNGTVKDTKTGLVWLRRVDCIGAKKWADAVTEVSQLRHGHGPCGLNDGSTPGDWRLPTRAEWEAMLSPLKGGGPERICQAPPISDDGGTGCASTGATSFLGLPLNNTSQPYQPPAYWTATDFTDPTYCPSEPCGVWYVAMWNGSYHVIMKQFSDPGPGGAQIRVWPVRYGN